MADSSALSIVVFQKVVALLGKLSEEQLAALADGTGDLVFESAGTTIRSGTRKTAVPRAPKPAKPVVSEVAARLVEYTDQGEAEKYLEATGLTVKDLLAVADELKISVRRSANKAPLTRELVIGAIGYKDKFGAVMGGPYKQ